MADQTQHSDVLADATVDAAEVDRFARFAQEWWDPHGKMGVLHRFNPVRLAFIRDAVCRQFGRRAGHPPCLDGIRILDIGCGGGLLCEPLARLGANVVGADPSPANIKAAQLHAQRVGLTIDYRVAAAEALAGAGERFEVVLAMEVVEHVADVGLFVRGCSQMVKQGGLMIAATLNRTLKSFALAIVGPNTSWAGCPGALTDGTNSLSRANLRAPWRCLGFGSSAKPASSTIRWSINGGCRRTWM